jgi:hypothetical protein
MMKPVIESEIATKAYQIDLSRISEGFAYSEIFCYALSMNQAKSELLKKTKYEGLGLFFKDEITYLNIPVIRYPEADLIAFEGDYKTQRQIDEIQQKRKRLEYFDTILNNPEVSHCYIRKHGSYYRPNASGYTSWMSFAGIYAKEDAVGHGKSCDELQIIPIDNPEHNKMIEEQIQDLRLRLIPEGLAIDKNKKD